LSSEISDKENTNMKYTRPAILNVLKASTTIMGVGKVGGEADNDISMPNSTPAYDGDE
jgi:hypothetical protein